MVRFRSAWSVEPCNCLRRSDPGLGAADADGTLEPAATFDPRSVRKTAKRLGMHSEASHRFERGTDPEGLARAATRSALCFGMEEQRQQKALGNSFSVAPEMFEVVVFA